MATSTMNTAPQTLRLPAPAKLNLFLHINGQRDDGYHLLQTLFQLLNFSDELRLEPSTALTLQTNHEQLETDDNLVLQAARMLQQFTGYKGGARLTLEKRIPAGAGLGGGSSDAATTLLGLNHLWQLGLSIDQLATIGLRLGADVPVFVRGHSAFAEGIGEQLTTVDLPPRDYLVIFPGMTVSTAAIFSDRQLTRDTPESTVATFLGQGAETAYRNDCEAVVRRLFPDVDEAMNWLKKQTGNSYLTGTGSSVFATLSGYEQDHDPNREPSRESGQAQGRAQGRQLLAQLPSTWKGFIARGCNASPLHQKLATINALPSDNA